MVGFGPYQLDQPIDEVRQSLMPLPLDMLAPKAFADETLWQGVPVEFLGVTWEVLIAVTRGRIYKICLARHYPLQVSEDEPKQLMKQVRDYWTGLLGRPPVKGRAYNVSGCWDTDWGNVVVDERHDFAGCGVMVFLTSNRPFARWPLLNRLLYHVRAMIRYCRLRLLGLLKRNRR